MRCQGTGFLNLDQVDELTLVAFEAWGDHNIILCWVAVNPGHDVQVCDCCGDGETWHGTPGEHHLEDGEPFPECS
jgi:hypothetical protein